MQYTLRAKNGVGLGTTSSILYVTTNKLPTGMTAITAVSINPLNITLLWTDLTDTSLNGGNLPYYYQLEWYDNYAWNVLSAEAWGRYFNFIHIKADVFESNAAYQYRVIPKNLVGWGTTYSYVTITADRVPPTMNTPTTVSINPKVIAIKWNHLLLDAENGRDLIVFYLLEWD